MTIGNTINENIHVASGVGPYPFEFKAQANGQIYVYLQSGTSDPLLQASNTYTVTINSSGVGGSITFNTAPTNGVNVIIHRTPDYLQNTAIPLGALDERALETALDKLTIMAQDLKQMLDRSIKAPFGTPSSFNANLPTATSRAGRALGFDGAGALTTYLVGNILNTLITAAGSTTARTLENRFSDYANVLDYGALPYANGSSSAGNSTSAFAAALATGKPVYIPAALGLNTVYDIGDLVIPDGAVMFAQSTTCYSTTVRSNVVLRKPAAGCTVILDTSGTNNFHLSGFCVDGVNRSCHGIVCVSANNSRGILRDLTIRYCDTALGGEGAYYANTLDVNNVVITENVTGIRATIDSFFNGITLAGNIGDGVYQPTGANDNTYLPYKVEFNRGHGFNFFSCVHQTIIGGVIDRNYKLGIRCGGSTSRVSVAGGVYRRNGRNDVFGENAHFGFDGSSVSNVSIVGIVTATGADDGGGGPTTPARLVSWVSGNPSNIEITGNFSGVVSGLSDGTPTTNTYRLYDSSGTYNEISQGYSINRNGGSQFIASNSQVSIATGANYTATLTDKATLGTFSVRRRQLLITGRREGSSQRWYANTTILSGRQSGNAAVVDFRIDSQGGSSTTQFATTPNRLAYDNQTGNFTVGQVVTGTTSGATATISADADSGTTGILTITGAVGTFQDNEAITDPLGGAAVVNGLAYNASGTMLYATVNSDATSYTITGVNQTGNTMHYGHNLI